MNAPINMKPCPFCGTLPDSEPWHGGGPEKTRIGCEDADCAVMPNVTGETLALAAAAWNRRAEQPADAWPREADPFTYIIQHLNGSTYNLTKDECIHFIRELRDRYNAQPAKPVADRANELWETIKIFGLSNDKLALQAIRVALVQETPARLTQDDIVDLAQEWAAPNWQFVFRDALELEQFARAVLTAGVKP